MNVKKFQNLDECVIIILGATGDLAKRKLIPAIYNLFASGALKHFALLGVANTQTTMHEVLVNAQHFIPNLDPTIWEKMQHALYFYAMDFHDDQAYSKLCTLIETIETKHSLKRNRLFYLATMPYHFEVITSNLARCNIAEKHNDEKTLEESVWSRVVYEKPFGSDLQSAQKINQEIARVFDEKQVFRIDHYLGKELVANIALSRFTNRIFEPLWNNVHIDSVQIILSEQLGIGERGSFYDSYGALKDVVQNHILQILALICMESPKKFTAEDLRNAKAKVLSHVQVDNVILGQYEGYRNENNVNPASNIETFAALKLLIDNNRWRGVPFYVKTGRCLDKNEVSVHLKFKMVECLLNFCPMDSNYLTINIQPNEGFYLELNVKAPGVFDHVVPITMNFSHSTLAGPNTPAAYEVLLADVIRGDHFAFVREDEIEYSWKVIDQITQIAHPVYSYKQGTTGPQEIELLDPERKIKWRA